MKDRYGIIGNPLTHSASQEYFTKKFKDENIDAEYSKYPLSDISQLPDLIKSVENLKGLNVTIPYKEQVIPYLDGLEEGTRNMGAVNVIKVVRSGEGIKLIGYNSDLIGFQNSISPLLKPHHRKALILGTGGASKAVAQGLRNLGLIFEFVSRKKEQPDTIHYDDLTKSVFDEFTVIVNATPLGTYPNVSEFPPIPYKYLTKDHLLYDLVYNPPLTKFLEKGKEMGATIKNGEEMLVLQAIAAWNIWGEK
ncbi:MAG: shikimate dehydrogenase family protein [Dysgonomonas sp.]